jgi:hypothetical protein
MTGRTRSAACLLAMLAIASCTADGMMPPAEIGGSQQTAAPAPGTLMMAPQAAGTVGSPSATDGPAAAVAQDPTAVTAAAAPAFSGTEPSAAAPPANTAPVAAVSTMSTIQLAAITGAGEQTVAPLKQRIAARARERGIGVAGNGALPTHILRGYVSEFGDANSTTVIYVWDVVDPAGTRLHRIQGTARIKGAGGWSAVSADTMEAIADRTIDDLAQWLAARAG